MAFRRVQISHRVLRFARMGLMAALAGSGCGGADEPTRAYAVTASSTSPIAGSPVTFTAQLTANGASEATSGRVVTWTLSGGTATPSTGSATTSAAGSVSFTVTTSKTIGESFTASVHDDNNVTGTSPSVTTTLGPAAKYVVGVSSASPVAGAAITVTAQLTDVNGNSVATAGRTVTWSATGTGGSFASPTSTTNATGAATVSFTTATTTTSYTIIATDNSSLTGSSAAVATVAGPPAKYIVASSANAISVGGQLTITAQLSDANGNAAVSAGHTVTWSSSTSGGSFASATATTNGSGVASVIYTTPTTPASFTITATESASLTGTSPTLTTTAGGTPTSVVATGNEISVINTGATTTPAFQVLNENGAPMSGVPITYTSRTPGAATVSASGVVTGVALGQSVIVASLTSNAAIADSVVVAVGTATGPSLGLDLTKLDLASGTSVTLTLVADMRASGEKLGALTTQLTWDPTQLTYVSDAETTTNAGAVVNATNATNGSLTVSLASSGGFSGAVLVRKLTFTVTATKAKAALFSILPTEFRGATTFTDLLPKTVSIRYPLTTK